MTRAFLCVALLSGAAFGQSTERFEAADVHVSPHSDNNFNLFMRGPQTRAGRYEIRTATMVDLIGTAYGVDGDKVYGGPNWLEMDRYDVTAKLPAGSTPDSQKTMLQALLAERFHLVAHPDSRPMPAYILTASKHPLLKDADPAAQKGCQGKPRPQNAEPTAPIEVACHGLTAAGNRREFAQHGRRISEAACRRLHRVERDLRFRSQMDRTRPIGSRRSGWHFGFRRGR